jgi:hypothetical protein
MVPVVERLGSGCTEGGGGMNGGGMGEALTGAGVAIVGYTGISFVGRGGFRCKGDISGDADRCLLGARRKFRLEVLPLVLVPVLGVAD